MLALQEMLEVAGPVTVNQVIRQLQREGTVPLERVLALRELVLEARRDTEQDLQDHAPCAELQGLLQGMVEDLQLLTALLRQLANRLEQHQDHADLTQELVEADAQLAESQRALGEWETRQELRCPNCGEPAAHLDWVCPRHGVAGLYPDPESDLPAGQAELGDHYLTVFHTYQDVLDGNATLQDLESTLTPLEAMLRRFVALARGETAHGDTTLQALERLTRASNRSLEGLKRMRQASTTRQTRDLNAGWAEVFTQATEIQQCVPLLARAFGGAAQRALVTTTAQDQMDIDFD